MIELSVSTQVGLLLTLQLSARDASSVLNPDEWRNLCRSIGGVGQLEMLLHQPQELLAKAGVSDEYIQRIQQLLSRGVGLAIASEKWSRSGVWILGVGDPEYPRRVRESVGEYIPPILFGYGNRELLVQGGVAITDERVPKGAAKAVAASIDEKKTAAVGLLDLQGSRDVIVELLEQGGQAVGITYKDLLSYGSVESLRRAIMNGRLVLLSSRPPGESTGAPPIYEPAMVRMIADDELPDYSPGVTQYEEPTEKDPPAQQMDLGF